MFVRVAAALVAAFVSILGAVLPSNAASSVEASQARPWHLQPSEKWVPADPSEVHLANRPVVRVQPQARPAISAKLLKAAVTRQDEYALTLPGNEHLWADPIPLHQFHLNDRLAAEEEAHCLALGLYHEARGESELGQIAVAQVILNRVRSSKYPDSICGVVFENEHRFNACQFSFACDGRGDKPENWAVYQSLKRLSDEVLCHPSCSYHAHRDSPLARLSAAMRRASHYHTTAVRPGWSTRIRRVGQIGAHIFYISDRVMSSL